MQEPLASGAQHQPAPVATLSVRRARLACVACGSARLAAGGGDGALRLWRWRPALGWQPVGRAAAHRYGVAAVAFAASGAVLATAGGDGAARVWAADGPRERRALAAPGAAAARALCWAGGERLCVGHDDGGLRVWAVRAGALLAHVRAHEGALAALAAPAGGALLLAACSEGVLKAYDAAALARAGAAGGPGPAPLLWEDGVHDLGALCGAAWARGAATGGRDSLVRVWRVRGAGRTRALAARGALAGHAAAVTALAGARGLLLSASLDGTARLWAAEAGACLRVLAAHARAATCAALAQDGRYAVTGADDDTLHTWALGALALQDALEPVCAPAAHFALGDLEGIGPVAEAADEEAGTEAGAEAEAGAERAQCVWRAPGGAAINSLASAGPRLAAACGWVFCANIAIKPNRLICIVENFLMSPDYRFDGFGFSAERRETTDTRHPGEHYRRASSDGRVRVFCVAGGRLRLTLELPAHAYAALAVDLGAGLLLSGGRDGRARLGLAGAAGGGGAVRDARLSPARPPLLLLASDDGVAAVWGVEPLTPEPLHARAAAHDAGVLSCDFERGAAAGAGAHLLATGGRDGRVRLWRTAGGALAAEGARAAHAGGAVCVRWGEGAAAALLATGGADRWARVWRVALAGGRAQLSALAALPAAAGGAVATCPAAGRVAVGSLGGELALWRLPAARAAGEGADARAWGAAGVLRWLREYVTRAPGAPGATGGAEAARLERAARRLDGARLLDAPLRELLHVFGYATDTNTADSVDETDETDLAVLTDESDATDETEVDELVEQEVNATGAEDGVDGVDAADEENAAHEEDAADAADEADAADAADEADGEVAADVADALLERLRDELLWLRRDDVPDELESRAPHSLRCPLTHRLLREPARAADGYTYERQNFLHWQLASGGLRSPVSGRRLHSAQLAPNYGVREALRRFVGWPRLAPAPVTPHDG
ncbi:uncharacterized WD repeat-containing protein all2124-like [Bicyclus anynana]|uniref:Uncharacterized WD repeat-containing protein all2124-like n=1 Tax=Bicyclus anynana TaxID=110368 RepID=A0ABM3LU73_BICAN|nr:uncharacterized WD repeat-containing protein all2124-like [Bicyclus anynana]